MKKRHQQNQEIDQIMCKLLKTAFVQDEVIEQVIASPKLFDSIQTRIKAQQSQDKTSVWQFWTWQKIGLAFGVLAVLILGASNLISVKKKDDVVEQKESTDFQISQSLEAEFAVQINQKNKIKKRKMVEPIVYKKETPKPTKSPRIKPKIQPKNLEEQEFYPLTFAGDLEEAKKDGQIIRVELPRESLNAMGLNLASINESVKVKAEFLISSDGITKGVRLVK